MQIDLHRYANLILCSMNSCFWAFLYIFSIFLGSFPGHLSAAEVSLQSLEIFQTHELLHEPTIYFHCKGENKTFLPDVKKANVLYTFRGEESWQVVINPKSIYLKEPCMVACVLMVSLSTGKCNDCFLLDDKLPLTEFSSKKCKRCGFYEKDVFYDDKFDEWEFCPSDFTSPGGKLTHVKEKEFNATFICLTCSDVAELGTSSLDPTAKGMSIVTVIFISAVVTILVIIVSAGGYRYWQKRKRQQEQARFLKLFEEQDDIEDELGLRDVI